MEITEDRCLHEMLILNGRQTCAYCLDRDTTAGRDATVAIGDILALPIGSRLDYGLRVLAA